jgi:hypothetical protein
VTKYAIDDPRYLVKDYEIDAVFARVVTGFAQKWGCGFRQALTQLAIRGAECARMHGKK